LNPSYYITLEEIFMSSDSWLILLKVDGRSIKVTVQANSATEAMFIAKAQYGSQYVSVLGKA
jgi:hypothetical protein